MKQRLPWLFRMGVQVGTRKAYLHRRTLSGHRSIEKIQIPVYRRSIESEALAQARVESGLRRRQMAQLMRMSGSHLHWLETGQMTLPPEQWKKALHLAHFKIKEIANGKDAG